ncbi:Nipped-B-like protein B [Durusdinium trenchii]|uniref:Nipped-B-like protein B n=1 Tax=Durusdinium trenchii TaxID=1381693 RepID=A0ABP0J9Q5_9DINO
MWYFVRQGDEITQKEQCIESLGMKAKVDVDPDMRSALTSEDGLLRPGALPKVSGASAAGSKALLQAITSGVAAPKKKKKEEEEEEAKEVEPQTWVEKANALLPDILKEASEGRKLSIKLNGMEFAEELSKDLLSHAGELEDCYKKLATKVGEGNGKVIKAYVNTANELMTKGSKAQAGKTTCLKSYRKRRRLEDLPDSQTVKKFADLIGRGKMSIDAAATIARSVVRQAVHKTIARLMAWSMEVASSGVGPDTGFAGEPLAKTSRGHLCGQQLGCGWRACFFAFKADLKARHELHNFKRYYRCNEFCDRCLAMQGTRCPPALDYRNVTNSSAWHLTAINHQAYMEFDASSLSHWDAVLNVLAMCTFALQRCTELMDLSGVIFSEDEAQEAGNSLKLHLRAYFWLAAYHYQRRQLLFKTRSKTHYNEHIADEVLRFRINPATYQNFEEEAFLGRIKAIGIHCHGRSCTRRLYQRYLLTLAVFLEDHERVARQV